METYIGDDAIEAGARSAVVNPRERGREGIASSERLDAKCSCCLLRSIESSEAPLGDGVRSPKLEADKAYALTLLFRSR